jgi:hypothetical protein
MADNTAIAWKILFGEDFQTILDPNEPSNLPRIKADNLARLESLERFMNGQGRVLFEQWRVALRVGLLSLLETPDEACHCSSCVKLMRLRMIYKLWFEAQQILEVGDAKAVRND